MHLSLYNLEPLEKVVKIKSGDNHKEVLIVFDAAAEANEPQQFLEKILSAVTIPLDEVVRITKITDDNASLVQWDGWRDCRVAIFFGVAPSSLGIQYDLPPYQPVEAAGRKVLKCDDLGAIQQTEGLKKSLWIALQKLFPKDA